MHDHSPPEHSAIRTDLGAIFVSLELSRSTWLITSLSPGAGEKLSKHVVPAGDLAAYAGTYANRYFGPVEIAVQGDGLVLTAGPDHRAFPLAHWSGASFTMTPTGENAPDGTISEVRFTGPDDRRSAVAVEFWDSAGLGTFTR